MRVLHVTTRYLRGGGAERNLRHFVQWQRNQGMVVDVAVGADSIATDFPPGVGVHVLPELVRPVRPRADWHATRALARLMELGVYDAVHTHESKAGIVGRVAARRRTPLVIHSVHIPSFGPSYPWPISQLFLAVERFCASTTDMYITVGDELRDIYVRHGLGAADRYSVIHSPIDIETFAGRRRLSRDERASIRLSFGVSDDLPIVAAVGTLERRKRHALMISNLAPLLAARKLRLLIAGEGPERPNLEALTSRLGVSDMVDLLGHVDRVPDLFGAATMLVHTASREGVPQVVIQALAAGLPVIATRVEGLREVAGASVITVSRDGGGLSRAVAQVLNGPQRLPAPVEALAPWTRPHIETQIATFHEQLERIAGKPLSHATARAG